MLPSGSSIPSLMVNPATTSGLFSHLGGMFRGLGVQGLAYAKQTMHDAVDDMASGMELKDVYERYEGLAEHPEKLSAKDAVGLSVDTAMSGIQMALNMADFVGSATGRTQEGVVIQRANDAGHRAVDNAFVQVPVAITNFTGFLQGKYRPTTGWVTPAAPVSAAAAAPTPAAHNPNPPHLSQQLNAITALMVQGRSPSQPPVISVIEIMSGSDA